MNWFLWRFAHELIFWSSFSTEGSSASILCGTLAEDSGYCIFQSLLSLLFWHLTFSKVNQCGPLVYLLHFPYCKISMYSLSHCLRVCVYAACVCD